MIKYLITIVLFVFSNTVFSQVRAEASVEKAGNILHLENKEIDIAFNLTTGRYSIKDKIDNLIILDDAGFSADGWSTTGKGRGSFNGLEIKWAKKNVTEADRSGISVELTLLTSGKELPEYLFSFTLFDDASWVKIQTGMRNTLDYDCRFMTARPINNATLFPQKAISDLKTLNGAAGKANAEVLGDSSRSADNSMLLTALVNGKRSSIVWGGLHYKYYYATTYYNKEKRTMSLEMKDPVGRLIKKGEEWWCPDTYYLGLGEQDPFIALEDYGLHLRAANNANPNLYDFPTLCGWAVGALSGGGNINTSVALIKELDAANTCGLTKYTKVAVRLEPDSYCYTDGNTQQGWWDDAHWSSFGHLVYPYDTFAKWCKAVESRNGVPFTYFQCGMPSDDFAKAHPEWMLNKNIDKLHLYHPHQLTNITFDYTNKELQKHVLSVWNRLRDDGMKTIKFDYPETTWRPEGGFSDAEATTTSAYTAFFELARTGLGKDARLIERNLGASERPILDVTAGVVDMQRTTGDTNEFISQHISTCGLRWYKNRTVFSYYQDSKHIAPLTPEIRQSMLTMITLTSGMFELATSFEDMASEMIYDISRIYPMYDGIKSPRPVDAFTGVVDPMVYSLSLTPNWHNVTLFNTSGGKKEISVSISDEMIYGGLALESSAEYYVYDFWSDKLVGKLKGTDRIKANLNKMACAVYSVKKVSEEPQLISTNRHLFQGWMDTKGVEYNAKKKILAGKSSVISEEPFKMVIALNGKKVDKVTTNGCTIVLKDHPAGSEYKVVELKSDTTEEVAWEVCFK